jgi:hypothetical protein
MFEAARPICCSFLVKLTFAANLKAEGSRKSPPKRQCPSSREVIGVAVVNTAASDRLQAMDFDLLYSGAMFKTRRPGLRAEFQTLARSSEVRNASLANRSSKRPSLARRLTRQGAYRGNWSRLSLRRARHFLSQPAA